MFEMQNLLKKFAWLALSVYLFVCLVGAQEGVALCLASDGHIGLKIIQNGSCTSPLDEKSSPNSVTAIDNGTTEKDHCGPCIDVALLSQVLNLNPFRIPSNLTHHKSFGFASITTPTFSCDAPYTRNLLSLPLSAAGFLLKSIRSVILLN